MLGPGPWGRVASGGFLTECLQQTRGRRRGAACVPSRRTLLQGLPRRQPPSLGGSRTLVSRPQAERAVGGRRGLAGPRGVTALDGVRGAQTRQRAVCCDRKGPLNRES